MLDDHARRRIELAHAFERAVGVSDVVVAELLALQELRRSDTAGAIAIERGLLVRVFAVAKGLLALDPQRQRFGQRLRSVAAHLGREPAGNARIVAGRVRERLRREALAERARGRAAVRIELSLEFRIVGRVDDHGDVGVVLGRAAQHGRAADVDVLDRLVRCDAGACDGLREWIEVDDQQVDRADAVCRHHRIIDAATAEQPAVDARVKRLHAAVHDLGKAGVVGDFTHRDGELLQQLRGSAGRQQLDAASVQRACELGDA